MLPLVPFYKRESKKGHKAIEKIMTEKNKLNYKQGWDVKFLKLSFLAQKVSLPAHFTIICLTY